ncbi:MAG: DUF6680 family protein [Acidobacteriaceae bacterium]
MAETTVLWATGLFSVLAIMAAPISALWIQRKIEDDKALRQRRQAIFNALWVNRRRQFWVARVDALNMIDIEFIGQQRVLDAWQALFAHYVRGDHPGTQDQIFNEREELFATLLYEMSRILKYKFSRTYVRDNIYRPTLHGKLDEMELETRSLINGLLKSDALPVRFVGVGAPDPREIAVPNQDAASAVVLPGAQDGGLRSPK